MKRCIPLEPEAEAVCEQSLIPPLIFQLPPEQGRQRLEDIQNSPVHLYPAHSFSQNIQTGVWGTIPLYFVVPENQTLPRRVILYIHGAGWVFGSFHTHEKLVRELAARTDSLVVFPEYTRAPEAKYPVAIEQCYYILSHLREILSKAFPGFCHDTPILAGDSAGGNIAIALTLMAGTRSGPDIQKLLLYYPVTNAFFDTESYHRFAEGYYLYRAGMQWFWKQYLNCPADRNEITASPLRTDPKLLSRFPETMIINGQADVLCSEGEAFGEKLRSAGVSVTALRIQGTIHDFVMLNALDQTNACRTAMDASTEWIKRSAAFS